MKNFLRFFKTDTYRAYINGKLFFAIIMVAILPFLAKAEFDGYELADVFTQNSIFDFFDYSVFWSEIGIINFIIISFVYADCFCDDISSKNYIYSITRGNVNSYVASKVVTVCIISVVTYVIGMLLFLVVSSCVFGFVWELPGGEGTNRFLPLAANIDAFSGMISGKHYLLLYLCCIFIQSLIYPITAVGSLLASLFIRNKLLVLCVPTLIISAGNYLVSYVLPEFAGYKFFYSTSQFYDKGILQGFLIVIGTTILIVGAMSIAIRIKMGRLVIE